MLLSNPTFRGEVTDKEFFRRRVGFSAAMKLTEHRLHIVGDYIYNDEIVQVNRIFIVSRYLYDRFDIGDTIP